MSITGQSKILLSVILLLFLAFNLFEKISENTLLLVTLFGIGYIVVEFLVTSYIKFILEVRQTQFFQDNRTANFMTWDILKFVLVLAAILSVVILGLNKVLNNETIATLLGGLVGSLLTLKGSYSDLPMPKNEKKGDTDP